ncbi:VWA domain-containing protein [Mycolicibacterium flavescens]|uniref:VWFA domain-containing protein n=1 Tax=Mycolicibacterium flavescens TaxID=1776 RepID=A0A1E3RLQ5_MYCFV|nr:VWA domain-containing protein [Mycolicibacterium flavescens]MCV7281800.1 VWA domain-containing protein [Mycolicibacterium flavescens]ODQ90815.1 hypothetical protein BHQ18_08815 [Mycolicibacterium flavescens]
MTFLPVLPVYVLAVFAAVIVIVRVVTLYRLLVRTPAGRYRTVVLRWSGLTFAVLLLVLAALRPGYPLDGDRTASATASYVSDVNLILVVDRSVTSRVADYGDKQARMVGIRDDITALLDEYRGARVAMIGFATKAAVDWPLSADEFGFRAYAKNLSAYSLTAFDAVDYINPTSPNDPLRQQLEQTRKGYPRAQNVVFYFGDGTLGSKVQYEPFDVPTDLITGGAVFGYGTANGGPIPGSFAAGRKAYLPVAGTSTLMNSSVDEQRLESIADSLKLPYFHREAGQDITPVLPAVNAGSMPDVVDAGRGDPMVGRTEWYWVFALLASALVLVEMILTVREYRRNRLSRSDFTAADGGR